jgi:prevent-host-death family protein
MQTANVHQAKTNLSKLLDAAARGEDVIITRRGGAVTEFRLVPVQPSGRRGLYGALAGEVLFAPDYDGADQEIAEAFAESLRA